MKLLIATQRDSDLSEILKSCAESYSVVPVCQLKNTDMDGFDALAVLGGTGEKAVILDAESRIKAEEFADKGRPVFLEFVNSFRCVYSAPAVKRTHHRLLWADQGDEGLESNDILDARYNDFASPYFLMPHTEVWMKYHDYLTAHSRCESQTEICGEGQAAFWKDKNILSCGFRMCDYAKAMFSPQKRWDRLVEKICEFLTGKKPKRPAVRPVVYGGKSVDSCVEKGLKWLENFLVEEGAGGILEGLSHHISPDGKRQIATNVRTDCSGEAGGAFLFSDDPKYRRYAENLFDFVFEKMMIKGGDFDGMLRWTEEAWEVCYQDDVARAVIPALLAARMGITDRYLPQCRRALRFLVRTTARDGLRRARTDNLEFLSGKSVFSLSEEESGYPSAHYNSWYLGALLLFGMVTGEEWALSAGQKGMERLMELYPDTAREHSETSEMCRLIFPLALLFEATGEKRHREMLFSVFSDLRRVCHPSGGYTEWDTGYKAACSKTQGGECSLLTKNGDPVCDLLYSVNWLPLGFCWAGAVTGDEGFWKAFDDVCVFLRSCQAQSADPLTDGSWGRGWDAEEKENNGAPHDVGWGPCAVESGWTVSEITMGICVGKRLKKQGTKH